MSSSRSGAPSVVHRDHALLPAQRGGPRVLALRVGGKRSLLTRPPHKKTNHGGPHALPVCMCVRLGAASACAYAWTTQFCETAGPRARVVCRSVDHAHTHAPETPAPP